MKKNEVFKKQLFPLNLQFFADGDSGTNDNSGGNTGEGNNPGTGGGDAGGAEQPTITQSQLSAIATKEKKEGIRTGKKEALKDLGFTDEAQAKKALELLNAMVNTQKTQEQIDSEALSKAIKEKQEAEDRAAAVEAKLSILTSGVKSDCVDDVYALATTKVTEDKNLDAVLKEMKKDSRYASFFSQPESNTNNNSGGTGNPLGNNNSGGTSGTGGNPKENFGAQLAKQFAAPQKKSSFFKD